MQNSIEKKSNHFVHLNNPTQKKQPICLLYLKFYIFLIEKVVFVIILTSNILSYFLFVIEKTNDIDDST